MIQDRATPQIQARPLRAAFGVLERAQDLARAHEPTPRTLAGRPTGILRGRRRRDRRESQPGAVCKPEAGSGLADLVCEREHETQGQLALVAVGSSRLGYGVGSWALREDMAGCLSSAPRVRVGRHVGIAGGNGGERIAGSGPSRRRTTGRECAGVSACAARHSVAASWCLGRVEGARGSECDAGTQAAKASNDVGNEKQTHL
ncbi:hypothetical protein C8R44DRAFT_976748 [Mycena epipterygia]|nr:hypothetical protein C8R44DRAFT_976748 [Mycena epipterygia]